MATPEEIRRKATEMHNLYEVWAEEYGWSTQKECQVNFNDLPAKNQQVMEEMAKWHLAQIRSAEINALEWAAEHLGGGCVACAGNPVDAIRAEINRRKKAHQGGKERA